MAFGWDCTLCNDPCASNSPAGQPRGIQNDRRRPKQKKKTKKRGGGGQQLEQQSQPPKLQGPGVVFVVGSVGGRAKPSA